MSRYRMVIDGKPIEVDLTETGPGRYRAEVGGKVHDVLLQGGAPAVSYAAPAPVAAAPAPAPMVIAAPVAPPPPPVVSAPAAPAAPTTAGARAVAAPMPGKVIAVNAKAGDAVKRGAPIVTIEAMKMNVPIPSPLDGKVVKVVVNVGDAVQSGQLVAEVSG
jgi:biotin carboxyl carrier protein